MDRYAYLSSLYLDTPYHSLSLFIEARLQRGLPKWQINGLSPIHSREASERIRSALHASGIQVPYMNLIVNLSPVDVRKHGAYLDLSIALCIMLAIEEDLNIDFFLPQRNDEDTNKINEASTNEKENHKQPVISHEKKYPHNGKNLYLGELALSGQIHPIQNLCHLLSEAKKQGFKNVFLPEEQISLARLIPNLYYIPLKHLGELIKKHQTISYYEKRTTPISIQTHQKSQVEQLEPFALELFTLDACVQKALALSAAGWHSLLLIGPPGSGKTSIARALLSLLPPLSTQEAIEILVRKNPNSLKELEKKGRIVLTRPFRMPHHSSTRRAMIGGGNPIQLGEASRAHNGLLVLDELGEFSRETLQALREPLQEKEIHISRASFSLSLPARFLLCATTNPCPCGDLRKRYVSCSCTDAKLQNYMNSFMGALRDRIDIEVWVDHKEKPTEEIDAQEKRSEFQKNSWSQNNFQKKIKRAHTIQKKRFFHTNIQWNADIKAKDLEKYAPITNAETQKEWKLLYQKSLISYRALDGIRRLARTLADMEASDEIRVQDIWEAASFRCLDSVWQ